MVSRSSTVIAAARGSAPGGRSRTVPRGCSTPSISPRAMAMPASVATMVLETDFTLTGRSSGGPRNASASAISPPRATISAWSWSSPAARRAAASSPPGAKAAARPAAASAAQPAQDGAPGRLPRHRGDRAGACDICSSRRSLRSMASAKARLPSAVTTKAPGPATMRSSNSRSSSGPPGAPARADPAQHRQAVDRDARGKRGPPALLDAGPVPVVGAVGGEVDDAAQAGVRVGLDHLDALHAAPPRWRCARRPRRGAASSASEKRATSSGPAITLQSTTTSCEPDAPNST